MKYSNERRDRDTRLAVALGYDPSDEWCPLPQWPFIRLWRWVIVRERILDDRNVPKHFWVGKRHYFFINRYRFRKMPKG